MADAEGEDAPPLDDEEFAALMAAVGPFERAPRVAVGVSGGPDSAALILLVDRWARALDGRATALVVDHGLRPESRVESMDVVARLAARGIEAHRLVAALDPGLGNRQSRARLARYALMGAWCAAEGVAHLLVAHHAEDQAETLLIRLGRGSGVDGLSAMAKVSALHDARLSRPLLDIPKARLEATCARHGWTPVDDPSNRDTAYRRGKVRALMPALAALGATVERLGVTARHMARARGALERATAELAAAALTVDERGFATLDRALFAAADEELALRLLGDLTRLIGGATTQPRFDRLERLARRLRLEAGQFAATLGGCRVEADAHAAILGRELAAMAPPVALQTTGPTLWDGRFRLVSAAPPAIEGLTLGALGDDARATLDRSPRARRLPVRWAASLPALRDLDGIFGVPHLTYCRSRREADTMAMFAISFIAGGGP